MRLLRGIAIGLGVVLLLVVVVVVGAMLLIDTRQVQAMIAAEVEESTGRQLEFEGELSLSFFPWLGFEQGEVELANAEGFEDDGPFARIESTEMRVRVMPLLRREVVLNRIVLRGLELNAGVDSAGRTNWADIESALAAGETAPAGEEAPGDQGGPGAMPFDLRVGGFELAGATINWRDRQAGTRYSVSDLDLTTGEIAVGESTAVTLDVTLTTGDGLTATLAAATEASVNLAPFGATLSDVQLDVEASGGGLPPGVTAKLAARTDAGIESAPLRVNLRDLRVELEADGGDLPADGITAGLAADVSADLEAGKANIDPLRLTLADELAANGRISAAQGAFDGRLDIDTFDARRLAARVGAELPELAGDSALTGVAARLAFRGTPAHVEVHELALDLDDTRLQGSLGARLGERPKISARMDGDHIVLDDYMAVADGGGDAGGGDGGDAGGGGDPVAAIPLEALRAFDGDARFHMDRVDMSGVQATDVELIARLERGLLTIEQAGGNVAGGRLAIDGTFDARGDQPATDLSANVESVQAGTLLSAFLGRSPLTGVFDSSLSLNAAGGSLQDWLGMLDGEVSAQFGEGAIHGVDLQQALRAASARLRGDSAAAAGDARTEFSALGMSARIEDGVMRLSSLDLESSDVRASGQGDINLAQGTIDYRAEVSVTDRLLGGSADEDDRLRGLTVPVRLTGSVFAPRISVDLAGALRARVEQEVEQEVDEARDQVEEQLRQELKEEKEGLGDKLKDMLDF